MMTFRINGTNYSMSDNAPNCNCFGSTIEPVVRVQFWSVVPVFSLIILIVGTLANGCILLCLFARHRYLRTAFNIYVTNLVFCNLAQTWLQLPLYLINNLRSYWWLGQTSCTIYIYGFFINAIAVCSHALITINRVWAVTSPVRYRTHHTKKTSTSLCAAAWLYVHAVLLPGFIADAMYYRLPLEYGCFIDKSKQYEWGVAFQCMVFIIPMALIVLAYPYIAYKSLKIRLVGHRSVTAPTPLDASTKKAPGSVKQNERSTVSQAAQKASRRRTSGFLLLSFLTLSMVVCWSPGLTFYTVLTFESIDWPVFVQVATILGLMETVFDPLLFALALKDLRNAVKSAGRIAPHMATCQVDKLQRTPPKTTIISTHHISPPYT